jgi:hypothetical protein
LLDKPKKHKFKREMAITRKIKPLKLKTIDVELAVSNFLNPRQNLIVPNVHWGMDIHECDLLVITPAGYGWEIEIKVNKADLIKDASKWHRHIDHRIKDLWFAIPKQLEPFIDHIPERAGIIIVDTVPPHGDHRCTKIRLPISNQSPYKFSEEEKYKVARLGALRIWGLKRKVRELANK